MAKVKKPKSASAPASTQDPKQDNGTQQSQDQQSGGDKSPTDEKPAKQVKLVKMKRGESESSYKGPESADVHPSEVQNYRDGGWVEE